MMLPSCGGFPKPSEIRERILAEHKVLRRIVAQVQELAKLVESGQEGLCPSMRELSLALYETLRRHIDTEDLILLPVLHGMDSWGDVRAARLANDHIEQRKWLEGVRQLAKDEAAAPPQLAATVRSMMDDLLADMLHEERDILHPNILRDDVITIDAD